MFLKYIAVFILACAAGFTSSEDVRCGSNEIYNKNGSTCEEHCQNNKMVVCFKSEGCFCLGGLVRNSNRVCIPRENCQNQTTSSTTDTTSTTIATTNGTTITIGTKTTAKPKPIPNDDCTITEWIVETVDEIIIYVSDGVQTVYEYCFD